MKARELRDLPMEPETAYKILSHITLQKELGPIAETYHWATNPETEFRAEKSGQKALEQIVKVAEERIADTRKRIITAAAETIKSGNLRYQLLNDCLLGKTDFVQVLDEYMPLLKRTWSDDCETERRERLLENIAREYLPPLNRVAKECGQKEYRIEELKLEIRDTEKIKFKAKLVHIGYGAACILIDAVITRSYGLVTVTGQALMGLLSFGYQKFDGAYNSIRPKAEQTDETMQMIFPELNKKGG